MSHRIHEPNHAGECIFCGKYVGKDMNKTPNFVHIEGGDVNESGGNDVTTEPMTSYNERVDDVLDTLVENAADSDSRLGYVEAYEHAEKAKQVITSLIKELVAKAKPGTWVDPEDTDDLEWQGYVKGVSDFEQNLLKVLEEV